MYGFSNFNGHPKYCNGPEIKLKGEAQIELKK